MKKEWTIIIVLLALLIILPFAIKKTGTETGTPEQSKENTETSTLEQSEENTENNSTEYSRRTRKTKPWIIPIIPTGRIMETIPP